MCFLGVISFAAVTLRLSGIQFLAKGLWVALRTLLVVGARLVQILGCNEVKITVVHNWAASEAYSRSSKLLMTFLLRVRGRRRGEDVDHHNAFPLVTKERMSVKRASHCLGPPPLFPSSHECSTTWCCCCPPFLSNKVLLWLLYGSVSGLYSEATQHLLSQLSGY